MFSSEDLSFKKELNSLIDKHLPEDWQEYPDERLDSHWELSKKIKNELAKKNWILTMDIDLSVKFNQIEVWKNRKYFKKDINVYFGSRLLLNSKVNAKEYRKITGNIFNIILL